MIDYVIERSNTNLNYNKNLVIFCDSAFVCNLFNCSTFPKFDYLYRLMDECVNYLNILNNYNIKIHFGKIRSHCGIAGNQRADELANIAADIADGWKKENSGNFKTSLNPLTVDISFSLKKLYKMHEKERKMEWINLRNSIIEEKNLELNLKNENDRKLSKHFINSEFLFMKAMFDENDCVRKVRNIFKAEIMGLNRKECEVINKLQTEYINLNNFKYYFFKETTSGCYACNCNETVSHLLFDCIIHCNAKKRVLKLRNEFFAKLRKIHMHFKYRQNFNAIDILFPHTWISKPYSKDPDYKSKCKKNAKLRIKIIKCVVKFVIDLGRFNNEEYGM